MSPLHNSFLGLSPSFVPRSCLVNEARGLLRCCRSPYPTRLPYVIFQVAKKKKAFTLKSEEKFQRAGNKAGGQVHAGRESEETERGEEREWGEKL